MTREYAAPIDRAKIRRKMKARWYNVWKRRGQLRRRKPCSIWVRGYKPLLGPYVTYL